MLSKMGTGEVATPSDEAEPTAPLRRFRASHKKRLEANGLPEGSYKVVIAALLGNLGVAVSKYAAAALTGSPAMLAEAFHSTADTGNEFLLLLGRKRSRRPPDPQHPFGHGRELYFWAFMVAMSVFAVCGGLSIYEGITRVFHPNPLEDPKWNYVALGVAAIFETASWVFAYRELNRRRKS